jgi:hypothetical protein
VCYANQLDEAAMIAPQRYAMLHIVHSRAAAILSLATTLAGNEAIDFHG